jgi:hypothetical protein
MIWTELILLVGVVERGHAGRGFFGKEERTGKTRSSECQY